MLGRSFYLCSRSWHHLTWSYVSDGLRKFSSFFFRRFGHRLRMPEPTFCHQACINPPAKGGRTNESLFYNWTSGIAPSHGDGEVPSNLITVATVKCLSQSLIYSQQCSEPPWPLFFPTPADIQAEMVAENVLPKLCSLLASGSEDVRRASIALLWILSQHPPNQVGEVISQKQRGRSSSGRLLG